MKYSLHIGLNAVDSNQYAGWKGTLNYAEKDAKSLKLLAVEADFEETHSCIGPKATTANVVAKLQELAEKANPGDFVLVTYSGHGSQVIDENGDEASGQDQTICLYDRQLLDDELWLAWSKFKQGVHILIISDSCHSGTIARDPTPEGLDPIEEALKEGGKIMRFKEMAKAYTEYIDLYSKIGSETPSPDDVPVVATVKSISACKDEQVAFEDFSAEQGHLTYAILKAWSEGSFTGNYDAFLGAVKSNITKKQTPELRTQGAPDPVFDNLRPFTSVLDQVADREPETPDSGNGTEGMFQNDELLVSRKAGSKSEPGELSGATVSETFNAGENDIQRMQPASKDQRNSWDQAYALLDEMRQKEIDVEFIEPNIGRLSPLPEIEVMTKAKSEMAGYIPSWPHPDTAAGGRDYMWHLSDDHSQLAAARDSLMDDPNKFPNHVRIAHFDTGYLDYDLFKPKLLNLELQRNYVEHNTNAQDRDRFLTFPPEQQGHGAATLAILAGPYVKKPLGLPGFEGYVGAIPFAEVIPVRIQDSVALLKTEAFIKAVYHAIEHKCDVITMSMGGAPSKAWADAVNEAYKHGITIVTAAGNSWRTFPKKYLPEELVFPARFERVIGAAGVSHNHQPYIFDQNNWEEAGAKTAGGVNMQGNHGPDSQMWHVMAAYTPNVIWASSGKEKDAQFDTPHFILSGGGTSSATPQIAATAALWISKYRKELDALGYTGTWRQVEAVRYALFAGAEKFDGSKRTIATPEGKQGKYYSFMGQGALRAMNTLSIAPPQPEALKESPSAVVPSFPLFRTLFGALKAGPEPVQPAPDELAVAMLSLELTQLCFTEEALRPFAKKDLNDPNWPDNLTTEERETLKKGVLGSPLASNTLKGVVGKM